MNDYVVTVDENGSPHLSHYGVLGMKWGVRHDRQRAYQRASKKMNKLQKKSEKAHKKAAAAQNKARKSRYGITDAGRTVWENRQIKSGKLSRKADKATRKAEKWMHQMNKVFSETYVKDL